MHGCNSYLCTQCCRDTPTLPSQMHCAHNNHLRSPLAPPPPLESSCCCCWPRVAFNKSLVQSTVCRSNASPDRARSPPTGESYSCWLVGWSPLQIYDTDTAERSLVVWGCCCSVVTLLWALDHIPRHSSCTGAAKAAAALAGKGGHLNQQSSQVKLPLKAAMII